MTTFPSRLEREIALLVFGLRMRRMSSKERGAYFNGLVGSRVEYSLERRVADLIEELKLW